MGILPMFSSWLYNLSERLFMGETPMQLTGKMPVLRLCLRALEFVGRLEKSGSLKSSAPLSLSNGLGTACPTIPEAYGFEPATQSICHSRERARCQTLQLGI